MRIGKLALAHVDFTDSQQAVTQTDPVAPGEFQEEIAIKRAIGATLPRRRSASARVAVSRSGQPR